GEARAELGTLGYHHAQAGDSQKAASYFERAAAQARAHHANRDAVRFYRLALGELEKATSSPEIPADFAVTSRVREALADVLVLNGDIEEARSALERALLDTAPNERIARARRRRLL